MARTNPFYWPDGARNGGGGQRGRRRSPLGQLLLDRITPKRGQPPPLADGGSLTTARAPDWPGNPFAPAAGLRETAKQLLRARHVTPPDRG